MLHYALNRLHLVNGCRCCGLLPTEEVTDKYRTFLLVHLRRPLLELLVTAQAGGKLQVCYCLWIPRMFNAVFAPSKLTLVLQHRLILCCFMQTYGITGNFFQSDTANGTHFCTEVSAQQVLAQTDTLENLRTAIRTDGRDAHLRHNLFKAFIYSLDIVRLCCGIFFLDFSLLNQIVENGECHIRTKCTGTIT